MRLNILQKTLLTTKPNLVHISGHGLAKSGLVLVDESRNPETASGEALADLFALFLALNACYLTHAIPKYRQKLLLDILIMLLA